MSAATAFSALPNAVITATGRSSPFWLMCSTTRKPGPSGQPHVGEAKVERFGIEQTDGLADGLRPRRVEAHARKRELEQFEQIGLVVDQENSWLSAGFS